MCCANVRTWVRLSSIRVKGQVCACNLSVSGTGGSRRLSRKGERASRSITALQQGGMRCLEATRLRGKQQKTHCVRLWGPHHMCTAHTHACTHSSFLYTISDASFYISTISFFKMITLLKCEKTTVHPLKVQGSAIPAYSQARQPSIQCNKNTSASTGKTSALQHLPLPARQP